MGRAEIRTESEATKLKEASDTIYPFKVKRVLVQKLGHRQRIWK